MDRIKCLYFLILFSSLILQSLSIDEEIELPSGSHKVNFKSMQLKDSISENSVSTKNKFQKFSDTFKSSILKLKKSHKKIDLVFLVDSSSSVGKMNFLSEIKFVKKVLADFTVSYNHTRVAVVSFSSAGKVVRHIDQITKAKKENDKCTLINTDVPKIQFIGGGTYTFGALIEAQKIFESARKHSKKVIFLITDGFSNGNDPVPLALKLKQDNVTIFSVGIENGNQEQLYNVSSLPYKEHSFLLESFVQFESLARKALHFDFRVGSYLSTSDESLCHNLCDLEGNSTTCCDKDAECSCGITTGQYTCMCSPGYYGSGLVDNCTPCPNGTYWASWNLCKPCPDINHISSGDLTTGIEACQCKSGFKPVPKNKCEIIRCPKLLPPENGYFVQHPESLEVRCDNVLNAACGARCHSGYQLTGSSIRLCQENGTWSGSQTECSLKRCPSLQVPFYGMAICKNPDLDLFFDYSPRNFTFLAHFDNEELRITQPMPIDTDCNFKCGHGFALIGSSSRVCLPLSEWDGLQTVCKQILCPALPKIPFGIYEPEDCEGSKSSLGTNCSISCMEGFALKGPSMKICSGKRIGVWSNKNKHPKCIDFQPPKIICPEDYSIEMLVNETYGILRELRQPNVTDNSEKDVSITAIPVISQDGTLLPKGSHNFSFIAVDTFNNEASCNVTVTVVDKTPPVWDNCVDPDVIKVRPDKLFVEWEEPTAYDNSNESVKVSSSLQPGELPPGIYQVNYTAMDSSNNTNLCRLNITVEESKCHILESPKNGMSVCASNSTTVWCSLNCQPGFEVYLEESSSQDLITMECQHKEPQWKYDPWPDCEPIELPESIEEILHIDLDIEDAFCNNSTDNQTALMEVIRNQLCGDQANCTIISELPSCEEIIGGGSSLGNSGDENNTNLDGAVYQTVRRRRNLLTIHEETSTKRPKRMRPKGKLGIKINIYTRLSKKLGIWSHNITRSENLKRIQYELEHLHENPQLQDKLSEMKVDVDKLKVNVNTTCPLGRVTKKNICVKCPRGMFHHFASNKCLVCPLGTFAENTGQLECSKCVENFTTRRTGSRSSTDCLQKCPPGSMARLKASKNPNNPQKLIKSLMPYCKKCPPGEYQPQYDQISCLTCPADQRSPRGSKSLSQCVPKPMNPCSIPGTCKNRGQCISHPNNPSLFTCTCPQGFTGSYCETRLDLCLSAPCENGATCRHLIGEQMSCTCAPGFTGKFCEALLNPCAANSCQNHGECHEVEGEIVCDCAFGFYGDSCEFKQDYCTPNPCQAGTCFSAFNSYLCQCPPGVMGKRCHLRPCDYQPCPKNKLCKNLSHLPANASSFVCKCPVGYRGENCDEIDNPCDRHPCRNNGICKPVMLSRGPEFDSQFYDKYVCNCPVYFYGENCDQLVTPDFVLEFPNSQITHLAKMKGPAIDLSQISMCTWIETHDKQNYGTILSYATEQVDNMITLTDYNGLTLYINGSHVTSDIVLNDGRWHFLCVTWENRKGRYEMYVDAQLKFSGEDLGRGDLIVGNGVLVLGQEQDEIGGSYSASETFLGKLAYFDIWDRVLAIEEIHDFFSTCEPYHGSLYVWSDFKLKIEGEVRVLPSPFCKECPKNISVSNGRINFINNNAIYSCNEGFYVQPIPIRQCLRTALWQEPAPVCRAKTCPRLERPANTRILVTRYTVGGSVTYNCDENFTMHGRNKRICLVSGNWSGEEPSCISDINCPRIVAPSETMIISYSSDKEELSGSKRDYPIGTFASIDCGDESDRSSELICTEEGEWDGEMPFCGKVESTTELIESRFTTQSRTTINGNTKSSSVQALSSTLSSQLPTINAISTTEQSRILLPNIPENFWNELRNYLFHGCQSPTYRSVLCKVSKKHRFSDLSHNSPKTPISSIENLARNALENVSKSSQLNSLTIDSFYEKIVKSNEKEIPEDSFRQFISFSIDNISWNYHNLESYLQIDGNDLANDLVKVVSPVFNNFQISYDFEEIFSLIATTTSTVDESPESTTEMEKYCVISELPQLPNGMHEIIDGKPIYRCKDTFKMNGEFTVTCGIDGVWEVIKNGTCQRKCGLLQIPEVMIPQSMQSMMFQDVVKLECVRGYEFHGRPNVKCLPNGSWSKINGMCSKITCNKPKSGTLSAGKSYLYLDKVQVRCADGQIHEIQCQANGIWTPELGKC